MDIRKNKQQEPFTFDYDKVPPQDTLTETVLLGAILVESKSIHSQKVLQSLKSEHFYKPEHQLICEAILQLWNNDAPIEEITVIDQLRHNGTLDDVGGIFYVDSLTDKVASSANAVYWFQHIIYPNFIRREIIRIASCAARDAYDDTVDHFERLNKFIEELEQCKPDVVFRPTTSAKAIGEEFNQQFDEENPVKLPIKKYLTGYKRFDEIVTIAPDKIVLVAGHKKGLKTRFVHSLITGLAEKYSDVSAYWVTLEDSSQDQLRLYLASKLHIQPKWLKYRTFANILIPKIKEHVKVFEKFDIKFRDQSIKIKEVETYFRQFCAERPDKFHILIIDNVLSLADRDDYKHDLNSMYDYIYSVILNIRQRTHGLIIPIHHYNEDQMEKGELISGYRPRMVNLKGTEAAGRVANQILLTNYPRAYKDLMSQYSGDQKEILSHTWILDAAGNREDKELDEVSLIRFMVEPDFTLFQEIDQNFEYELPEPEKKIYPIPYF